MTSSAYNYVQGLRWETRFVISFIVVSFVALVAMLYADAVVSRIIASTLVILATGLATTLRHLLRNDYLHTSSFATAIALVPPISLATVYVGMLSSWMQRVGFGVMMRIGVTSLLLWSVVTVSLHLSLIESTVVFVMSGITAIMRQVSGPNRYLLPWMLFLLAAAVAQVVAS